MAQVVRMPLDEGGSVLVEVADADSVGIERVGRLGDVVRDSAETLQQALARVRPAAAAVLNGVRDMAQPPDKVTVEFGIKLTAEAGVVVAKAASEANFKIALEWSAAAQAPADRSDRVAETGRAVNG